MELYLIRHAQSLNNALPQHQRVEDPPITTVGHEQARCLARRAASLNLTRIISSPFLRALQTAEHLRISTGLAPEVRVDLHEKGGCVAGPTVDAMVGRPGMSRREINEEFPSFHVAAEIDGDGWWRSQPYETTDRAIRRARKLWDETRRQYASSDERIALVMHGDFKLLLLDSMVPERRALPFNGSLTHVSVSEENSQLAFFNCVRHLPNHLVTG